MSGPHWQSDSLNCLSPGAEAPQRDVEPHRDRVRERLGRCRAAAVAVRRGRPGRSPLRARPYRPDTSELRVPWAVLGHRLRSGLSGARLLFREGGRLRYRGIALPLPGPAESIPQRSSRIPLLAPIRSNRRRRTRSARTLLKRRRLHQALWKRPMSFPLRGKPVGGAGGSPGLSTGRSAGPRSGSIWAGPSGPPAGQGHRA